MKNFRFYFPKVTAVAVPIIFEIVNTVTGDWFPNGKLTLGKFITILIGAAYLVIMIYFGISESNKQEEIDQLKQKIDSEKRRADDYQEDLHSVANLVGYSTSKINTQANYLDESSNTQIRELKLEVLARNVCTTLYNTFSRLYNETGFTVNLYYKFYRNNKAYEMMIAHEGNSTNPRFYMKEKRLAKNRHKDFYYCDQLMLDGNPETVMLLTKKEVAKAFGLPEKNCKYLQYIGIPIVDSNSNELIFLLEINVMDGELIPSDDKTSLTKMLNSHFIGYKDYLLQMIAISRYAEIVDKKFKERYGSGSGK